MERISRMLRSGLAMMLAICMIISACPVVAFAEGTEEETGKEKIVYVSIGDSMTNGYGMVGYDGSSGIVNYANQTYANRFAAWLAGMDESIIENDQVIFEGDKAIVDHRQMAMSGQRAEDLHWTLELDYTDSALMESLYNAYINSSWSEDRWYNTWGFKTGDYRTWSDYCDYDFRYADGAARILRTYAKEENKPYFTSSYADETAIANAISGVNTNAYFPEGTSQTESIGGYKYLQIATEFYQKSVADADIISLALGNTNFGTYMLTEMMDVVMYNDTTGFQNTYNIERVFDLAGLDSAAEAKVRELIAQSDALIDQYFGGLTNGDPAKKEALKSIIVYCVASYAVNYIGSIEAILTLNPDVDIIQVALMNAYAVEDPSITETTLGDIVDVLYTPVNSFLSALPTYMQMVGKDLYKDATFYFAEADSVECLVEVFGNDFYYTKDGKNVPYNGLLNGGEEYKPNLDSTVRDRFVENIVKGQTFDMMNKMGIDVSTDLTIEEIAAYDMMPPAEKAAYAAQNAKRAKSIALYLAFENATIKAGKGTVTMNSLTALGGVEGAFSGIIGDLEKNAKAFGKENYLDAAATVVAGGSGGALTKDNVKALIQGGDAAIYAYVSNAIGNQLTADEIKSLCDAGGSDDATYAIVAGNSEGQLTAEKVAEIYAAVVNAKKAAEQANADQDAAEMAVYYNIIAGKISQNADMVKYLYENNLNQDVVDLIDGLTLAMSSVDLIKENYSNIAGNVDKLKYAVSSADSLLYLLGLPQTLSDAMYEDPTLAGILCMNARCLIGTGIGGHPSTVGHDSVYDAVTYVYEYKYTSKDETVSDIKYVLGEMKDFLETYGPEAADQLVESWHKYGYQDIVNAKAAELEETLGARYEHYKTNVLPALTTTADELAAQKAELTAQLTTLNEQLAAKKAELEAVIAEQEIGSIHTPDISIDTELGNNEQTEVPENDCEGAGNVADELAAAVADLEHAIAVIEALIADVQADIDDMVALATEIAEAITELEKTVADVAAAAMDLKDAFDAIVAVLTDDSAKATTETFLNVFNTAREAAYTAIEALELVMDGVDEDVAAIDASLVTMEAGLNELYARFDETKGAILYDLLEEVPELQGPAAAVALIMQTLEENKQVIQDTLNNELAALAEEYEPQIEEAKAAIEAKKAEIEAEITAKYAEYEQKAKDEIAAKQAEAQAKLDALNTELQGYVAEMEALAEDAAQEVIDGIQAQIDRVNADIAQVNEDLACAVDHINTELKTIHDQIVAEVNAAYADVLAELQKIHDDLVAAYNAAIEELKAAADKAIQDLIDAANKEIEKLGDIADEIKDIINGIFQSIRDDIKAVQDAINNILHGQLSAIEDLKNALVDLGLDGVAALVDELTDLIEELIHQATYADLNVDDGFLYVALGDDTALSEGYVELVAGKIEEEKNLEKGVDILFENYAKAGNTITKERENLSDVADADLITIGFGNVNMLKTAIDTALNGEAVSYDWASLVGAELVPYVQEALAEVYAEIDATIPDEEMSATAKAAVESIAYSAVEYAVELPQLIAEIREVNADALIIIVGQYNPMGNAVLDLMGSTMDLGEYIGYFVDAVAAHGIAYSLISGDAIFAEAPDVAIEEVDTKWSVLDLIKMLQNGFDTLNPSEAGDIYIANQILKALNITQLKEEPSGFFKDVFADDYYYDAVLWAVKMGITNGYGESDIFAPDVDCTRGQIATFLWRAAGEPAPRTAEMPFKDVADGEFYTTAVLWAAENGITNGYGAADIFAPDVTCTRGQIVTMLARYLDGKAATTRNPFVDVEEGAYYYDAVLWAAENEITNGYGQADTFAPDVTCTRAQIVTFLYRALYQHR